MSATPDQIEAHVEAGEDLSDDGDYRGALAEYRAAWELIPEPKYDHESAWQLLGAIGDAHFLLGEWEACFDTFQQVIMYIGGIDTPSSACGSGRASWNWATSGRG